MKENVVLDVFKEYPEEGVPAPPSTSLAEKPRAMI